MTNRSPAAKRRKVIAQPRRYLLEISERQAQLVNLAVELFARLGMGQFDMLDSFFPWESKIPGRERIRPLLQELVAIKNGAQHTYPGVHSKEISDDYRVLYDLHKVIRHRLAWYRDPNPSGWKGVNYDEPSRASTTEDLARINRVEAKK